jgi:ACS family hexuronate transporter-like MFS transporter
MSEAGEYAGVATGAAVAGTAGEAPPIWGYRWTICAMLFFATTINYVDRSVISILGPTMQQQLHWTTEQFGDVVSWFQFAYGIGFLGVGRWLDKVGVKRGFGVAIAVWSLAAMSHALARSQAAFSVARGALGLGESANFPGSIKAVAEWFPKKERALATGIFNAGSNVGAIVAPIMVPIIALSLGWRYAFVFTGLLVVIWLLVWWRVYYEPEQHPRISARELAYIRSDTDEAEEHPEEKVPWLRLLSYRQAWAFIIGKAMTDPVWWFYLFWLPTFLDSEYGVHLQHIALPLVTIYLMADVGSVAGGWLSGSLIKRGHTVNFGRKAAMAIAAVAIVPTMMAPHATSMWLAVAIVGVATASHQWWSANLFTTVSDMFPRKAVATMVGMGGFAGAISGMAFQRITGHVLRVTHNNYNYLFLYCGLAYVSAWVIIQVLVPRLKPAHLEG